MANISWKDFLTATGLLVAAYYIGALAYYYSKELKTFFARLPFSAAGNIKYGDKATHTSQIKNQKQGSGELEELNLLATEIQQMLRQASGEELVRQEIIASLQSIIRKYQNIRDTPTLAMLHAFIEAETKKFCSISLTAEEIKMLWDG